MKKFIIFVIIVYIISIISYITFNILFGWHIKVSSKVEIKIPLSAKLELKNTHGGFHGDGETFTKIYLTQEQSEKVENKIKENEHWRELPLTEIVANATGIFDKEMKMPEIENGYWFYLDRNSEATDKYNENDMYKGRYSRNYSVAVFDSYSDILYYYELDT